MLGSSDNILCLTLYSGETETVGKCVVGLRARTLTHLHWWFILIILISLSLLTIFCDLWIILYSVYYSWHDLMLSKFNKKKSEHMIVTHTCIWRKIYQLIKVIEIFFQNEDCIINVSDDITYKPPNYGSTKNLGYSQL